MKPGEHLVIQLRDAEEKGAIELYRWTAPKSDSGKKIVYIPVSLKIDKHKE